MKTRPYLEFDQELADAEADYWDTVWGTGGECGPIEDEHDDRHERRG